MVSLVIVLFVLGLLLIIGEFFTGSHVLLGLGLVAIFVGFVYWIGAGLRGVQVEWWAVVIVLVLLAGPVAYAVSRIRRTSRRQVTTGKEDLKGKIAVVEKTLDPEGTVLYEGELWNALSASGKIDVGAEVVIKEVQGLILLVEKK